MQEKLLRVWPRRDPYYRAYEPTTLLAQRHQFLLAIKTIAPAPKFGPAGADQQKQPISVICFIGSFARLKGSYRCI